MRMTCTTCCFLATITILVNAAAAGELSKRTISVSGEGTATAPPDMAVINTGVVTQAEGASEALAANNKAMKQLLNALSEHDVAAKDIQTSSFNVNPEYKRDSRGQRQAEIIGYRVTNQVRVSVRNLPDLGEVLDALVASGSNQIGGVSFGIDDPTGILNQARNRAISDARSRARLYAQAAGVAVGEVISISEQATAVPRPQHFGRAFAAEAAGSVPVATGEQEVRATIHMVFALEDER